MSLLAIYAIFAVATSITSLYELVAPVVGKRKSEGKESSSTLIYLIFFFMNILVAPLVFLSCIVPSFGERFRSSLYKGLYEDD